mmetsp:Transcript_30402/g.77340  ORF Transcript_30402/g.77340 Transcript_30402/m.77340 type:complete len:215 (+) Transcript_30402:3431-4075(+)
MACTHWHNAPAASDTLATSFGVKPGSLVYFSTLRTVESLMLSLSKFLSFGRNWTSFSSVLAWAHDGVLSITVMTAHKVFITMSGGLAYAFTSAIDFLSSFSSASMAASSAGMAFSRSRVASSEIAFVSFASCPMRIESASTCFCCTSALARSTVMTSRSSPHSFDLTSHTSCFCSRSMLISATCVRASSSLLKPFLSLSAELPSSFCLSCSMPM